MKQPDLLDDVLVIGGGPAGSTTAGLLASRGWRVRVVDRARFPRAKPCGECVNPGAVAALDRLGLLKDVEKLGPSVLEGWRIRTPASGPATGTFEPGVGVGLGVPRRRLDHALLRAAERRGAHIVQGTRAEEVESGRDGRHPEVRLRTENGDQLHLSARIVVGADGLRSITARSLGAYARRPRLHKLSLTVRLRGTGPPRRRGLLVLSDERVLGLAPVHESRETWNATVVVRSGRYGSQVSRDPAGFVRSVLEEGPPSWSEGPVILGGPWTSGPFDWPVRRTAGPGVVLVGDAAGYYDPLTGQGIYRSLRSAELAAAAVDRALCSGRSSRGPLLEYDRKLRREFRAGRWLQKGVEAVVSRRALREPAIRRLARSPTALSTLIGVTGDGAPLRSLLRQSFWTGLFQR